MTALIYSDDVAAQIFYFTIENLFDIVKLANVSKEFYKIVDKYFDRFFLKLILANTCDEILFITLQINLPDRHLLKTYRDELLHLDNNFFGTCLENYTVPSQTIKYLLMVKFYPKIKNDDPTLQSMAIKSFCHKNTNIENKLYQSIIKYWSTSSEILFNNCVVYSINYIQVEKYDQLTINTTFVKMCIYYDECIKLIDTRSTTTKNIMIKLLEQGADVGAGFNKDGTPISIKYFSTLCKFLHERANLAEISDTILESINLTMINALGCLMGRYYNLYEKLSNPYTRLILKDRVKIITEPFVVRPRELYFIFSPL